MRIYQDHQQEKQLASLLKNLEKLGQLKKCPSVTGTYAAMRIILFEVKLDNCTI